MSTFNISPFGFMPQDAVRNRNAGNAVDVANMNAQIYQHYSDAVRDYNDSMDVGRDYPGPKPQVPMGYVLGPADSFGFTWPMLKEGVFPPLPLHSKKLSQGEIQSTPNKIHILRATPGGGGIWFTAAEDDTFPSGGKTPPVTTDDGITGIFERVMGPVGNGWYKKVG